MPTIEMKHDINSTHYFCDKAWKETKESGSACPPPCCACTSHECEQYEFNTPTLSYSDHDPRETYDYRLGQKEMLKWILKILDKKLDDMSDQKSAHSSEEGTRETL